MKVNIPDFGRIELTSLVMDYNGTLAVDGELLPGVGDYLKALSRDLNLYVVTADTFGTARSQLKDLPVEIHILPPENQAKAKEKFVQNLNANRTAAIGNGRNDRLMLKAARIGIAVLLNECASGETLQAADIVSGKIENALELFRNPLRLKATLRG